MTTNVAALVERATVELPRLDDLWRIYEGYAGRTADEYRRVRQLVKAREMGKLLNSDVLFSLPESRHPETNYPVLGVAPMGADKVYFYEDLGVAGFTEASDGSWRFLDIPVRQQAESRVSHYKEVEGRAVYWIPSPRLSSTPVPPVPRSVAPLFPWTRKKCFVLFDAVWKTEALPVDPYLLERVSPTQFKILGHWDITDKERELMQLMGLGKN
jgi:hypothetical protein